MQSASEPCGEVALARTVFSSGVSVGSEGIPAMLAGKVVERLLANLVLIAVPPCNAAFRAAEFQRFHSCWLLDLLPAIPAETALGHPFSFGADPAAGETFPPAERRHLILGQIKLPGDRGVANIALLADQLVNAKQEIE